MLSDITYKSLQKRRNILHWLFSSPNNKFIVTRINLPVTNTYYHQLWTNRRFTVKESNFMYLNTYLCSYTDDYSMLINLSALTSEQKTRKIGYRDAILHTARKQLYHKPSLCIMLDYPWTPLPFNFNIKFKGFLQLLSVSLPQIPFINSTYIHNRCPNFYLQL